MPATLGLSANVATLKDGKQWCDPAESQNALRNHIAIDTYRGIPSPYHVNAQQTCP